MFKIYFLPFLFLLTAVVPPVHATSDVSHPRVFDAAIVTGISAGLAWLFLHQVEKNLLRQNRSHSSDFKNIRFAGRFLRLVSLSGLGTAGFMKLFMSQPVRVEPHSLEVVESDFGRGGDAVAVGESAFDNPSALTTQKAKGLSIKPIRPKKLPKSLLLFTQSNKSMKSMSIEDETRALKRLEHWDDGLLVTRAEDEELQRLERKRGEGHEERKVME